MSIPPGLCGVILAAGDSARMGTDKALLPWPPGASPTGQTFLSAAINAFVPFTEMVIVVVGKNEAALAPVVFASGASFVRNPAPERGQFSSLQVGLQEVLNHGRDAAVATLVDRPPVNAASLKTLCDQFIAAADGTWAIIPEFAGRHGHPMLLRREMVEVFLKAPPTGNAQEIEHQCQQHISYIQVDDPSITQNVNTPQDYAALTSPTPSPSR
jgi:molybdenum cofactor cytidylyltransferase